MTYLYKLNSKRGRENYIILIVNSNVTTSVLFNDLISIKFDNPKESKYILNLFDDLYVRNELKLLTINNVCPIKCKAWFKLLWQPFEYYEIDFMGMIAYQQLLIDIYNYETFHLYSKIK